MKKTLITLAALAMASVAQASNNVSADLTKPNGTKLTNGSDFSGNGGAYTMTILLDWNKVVDWTNADAATPGTPTTGLGTSDNPVTLKAGHAGSGNYANFWWGNGISVSQGAGDNSGNIYATVNVEDAPQTFNAGGTIDVVTKDSTDYAEFTRTSYAVNGKLVLTLTYNPDADKLTLYALKKDSTKESGYDLNSLTVDTNTGWDIQWKFNNFKVENNASGYVERAILYNTTLSTDQIIANSVAAVPEPATATLSLLALAGLAARRRRK